MGTPILKSIHKSQGRYISNCISSVQVAHSLGGKEIIIFLLWNWFAGLLPNQSLAIVNTSTLIIHFYLLEEIFLCDMHMFMHFLVAATWTKMSCFHTWKQLQGVVTANLCSLHCWHILHSVEERVTEDVWSEMGIFSALLWVNERKGTAICYWPWLEASTYGRALMFKSLASFASGIPITCEVVRLQFLSKSSQHTYQGLFCHLVFTEGNMHEPSCLN